jgi:transposase
MVTASDRSVVDFRLSPGNYHDAPQGRQLLSTIRRDDNHRFLIMDKAYEGDNTRNLAICLGYIPIVPPKSDRKDPWEYDKQLYKKRNEIERYFLRIKRFRRIFTRYDKLDIMFTGFILFAMVIDTIISVNRL